MSVNITQAIQAANGILPGPETDNYSPRWQAIILIGEFIESEPEAIWDFVVKWGGHENGDLRDAISSVLLEHLLEFHFELIFPRIEPVARENALFAKMFCGCWKFGQSNWPGNSDRFDALRELCKQQSAT